MSDALPQGWARTTLGELGRYINGRGFKKSEWSETGRPILRIQNLTGSNRSYNYYAGELDDRHLVRPGDLLISWAATLGAYRWSGPESALNQHIFKVESFIDSDFHFYLIDYLLDSLRRNTHGSGMVHITRGKFDGMPVMLPPIAEQRRIVESLEGYLSRIDAGHSTVVKALKRVDNLWSSLLNSVSNQTLIQGNDVACEYATLAEVADVQGGIQKQPKRHPVLNKYPFLRVANVPRGQLDLDDIHEIELFSGELERYELIKGDLLIVEGNGSPDQIGRAALWSGEIANAVYQNHLIRVRPHVRLIPKYLEMVWNSPLVRDQVRNIASSTSGLHTLSTAKVKAVRIPVPDVDRQLLLVAEAERWKSSLRSASISLKTAELQGRSLRANLLSKAFSGQLVPQDPTDESAAKLLTRIETERGEQPKVVRARRPRMGAPRAVPSGVQGELPL